MKKIIILLIIIPLILTSCTAKKPSNGDVNYGSDTPTQAVSGTNNDNANLTKREPETTLPEIHHETTDFVNIQDYIPTAVIDLKYATDDNFTGVVIYQFKDAYLRYGTAMKLLNASRQLEQYGYRIKIWDAFRPFEAQIALWNAYPNGNYVANPQKGYTSHNLGNTVDITLVTMQGLEVDMPTNFDDFTPKANRDYSDVTQEQSTNSLLLDSIMTNCGFKGYSNEWWHYEDTDSYIPDETFLPKK